MTGSLRNLGERLALFCTFVVAALRYWLAVFPRVSLHLRRLRRRAAALSDPRARQLALAALEKRSNLEGAAAFAAFVPWRRRADVVRALVALQAAYSYADVIAEQPSRDPIRDARLAHESLLAALEADRSVAAFDDFVVVLVADCRLALSRLPSYGLVAAPAIRCAERIVAFQSLSLGSAGELERWAHAAAEADGGLAELQWWEIAAAAGSSLAAYALIAAAASPRLSQHEATAIERAYFPAIGALHSLLDSLIDRAEDAATGEFSLIGRYRTPQDAVEGLERIARSAVDSARPLPGWRKHTLLTVAMACSYLADAPRHEPGEPRERVLAALGPLARPTMLVFALRGLATSPGRQSALEPAIALEAEPRRADARAT
jgi:tetraprenyl-beta-curcumene synthase